MSIRNTDEENKMSSDSIDPETLFGPFRAYITGNVSIFWDVDDCAYRMDEGPDSPITRADHVHIPMMFQGSYDFHAMKLPTVADIRDRINILSSLHDCTCFIMLCDRKPGKYAGFVDVALSCLLKEDWLLTGYQDYKNSDPYPEPFLTADERDQAWKKLAVRLKELGLDSERLLLDGCRDGDGNELSEEEHERAVQARNMKLGGY